MAEPICVRTIIADWLRANGYGGLAIDGCGCGVDDLAPCGGPNVDCVPAYVHRDAVADGDWYDPRTCGPGCAVCSEVRDDG